MRSAATGKFRRRVIVSATSVMVCAAAAVALAAVFRDDVERYRYLSLLVSENAQSRRKGATWLARRLDDKRITREAGARLDNADETVFDAVVKDLAPTGRWGPWAGPAWVRYLTSAAQTGKPTQRATIVRELGRIVWERRPHHNDPRIPQTIDALLGDEEPEVRVSAVVAAACLPEPTRSRFLSDAAKDPADFVSSRAARLVRIVAGEAIEPPDSVTPDEHVLRALMRLEGFGTATKPLAIDASQPEMLLLQTVRVSTEAKPEHLKPLFNSQRPAIRDLACVIALERFTSDECAAIAHDLLGSYNDADRISGALLAGLCGARGLAERLRTRAGRPGSWGVEQHCLLALDMLGKKTEGFDPLVLIFHRKFPKSTLNLALLHTGRLEGLDWMLNPLGEPGEGGERELSIVLDVLRHAPIVERYLPDAPRFPLWAEEGAKLEATSLLRDWYLVHRPGLRFDNASRTFKVKHDAQGYFD